MTNANQSKFEMSDTNGFTLLETLVAMGIFLLVIGGIGGLLAYSFHSKNIIWEQLSTQAEGRKVVQDITNELRSAAFSSIGAYPLESATAQEIVFYSNIDTDSWRERVRYFLSGATLKKGVIKPSGVPLTYNPVNEQVVDVAHDVTNGAVPMFSYYGVAYDGVTNTSSLGFPVNVAQVRVVGVKLLLEENPNLSPAPLNVEGKVEVRNLKSN